MAIITITSASFCGGGQVAEQASRTLDYTLIDDDQLLAETEKRHDVPAEKLRRTFQGTATVLNKLTHDQERHVAYLRAVLAGMVRDGGVVFHGLAGLLLPPSLTQVLRVCLAANYDFRVRSAAEELGISERDAQKRIRGDDTRLGQWTTYLLDASPWDESLYDVVIPMHDTAVEEATKIIAANSRKPAVITTPAAEEAMSDFLLATRINVEMAEKGHDVEVSCSGDLATITINRQVLRMKSLERELEEIALAVPGVKQARSRLGKRAIKHQTLIYPRLDLDIPSRVLLVDDEKEFVHTLSERLETRNFESSVAYDGEEALSVLETDEPEVMVLDLKMPGIDGLEVLRRVKRDHPEIEVIILTGHGSEKEQEMAMKLGAFAYLQKPADIDVLTETMKGAYRKVREARQSGTAGEDGAGS